MADFTAFKDNMLTLGRIDFDHIEGFQCVDLPREWWYENGITNTGGNPTAISYWTNPPQSIQEACDRIESSDAQAGDVVVLRTNGTAPGDFSGDGHIGNATGNINDTHLEILEQHGQGGTPDGLGGNAIRTRWISRPRVAGLYRIKSAVATPPALAAQLLSGSKYVFLPPSVSAWTAYRVGSGLRKGTSDVVGTLAPAEFGGLRYEIQGWISDKAVIITTETYGQVAIWVKDTDAQFQDDAPVPVPTPVVEAPPVPMAPPAPVVPTYTFEKLPNPLNVQLNKDGSLWDLQKDTAAFALPSGKGFEAYGKATRQDGDGHPVYFMSKESFGDADTTGTPTYWQGVNTVDLGPAPVDVPATPVTPGEVITPAPVIEATPVDNGEKIPVTINHPNPDAWKTSFKTNESGEYKALISVTVRDLDGKVADLQLPKGAVVKIAGKFTGPDNVEYWRSEKSAVRVDPKTLQPKDEDWRGIPVTDENGNEVLEEDFSLAGYIDDGITSFENIMHRDGKNIRRSLLKASATAHADASWLAGRLKKRSK